jgi:ABC-type branched-subunit amino acid transport system ATPase component
MSAILQATGLSVGYGQLPVVRDLDLEISPGEVVALLGPNGAGKTTTLLSLSGALPAAGGTVLWEGSPSKDALHKRVRKGLSLVTEDRSVIMSLTVKENLRLARVSLDRAVDLFPELKARVNVRAGNLSGGEQQMLSLARALARSPKVLLADELSMGLAPIIVQRLLTAVRTAATEHNVAALIVEQHVTEALRFADRAYVMVRGAVRISGTTSEIRGAATKMEAAYLGKSAP